MTGCLNTANGKIEYNTIVCLLVCKQGGNTTVCIWECIANSLIKLNKFIDLFIQTYSTKQVLENLYTYVIQLCFR